MNYNDLVSQAEKAVSPVKDPELKRIAFEKILDALLRTNEPETTVAHSKTKSKPKSGRADSNAPTQTARKRSGTQAYIEELADEDFFNKPKTIAAVKAELANRGHHIPLTSLSGPLQNLCKRKRLRRQKSDAADNGKKTFQYSNW